jgi:hypothetical protein
MFGQAHHRSMPFFDHLLQVRRVTVTQLFDRINADAFKHLLVMGADSFEFVEVATPVLYRRSAAYRRILETPQTLTWSSWSALVSSLFADYRCPPWYIRTKITANSSIVTTGMIRIPQEPACRPPNIMQGCSHIPRPFGSCED